MKRIALANLLILLFAATAHAQIANGDFTAGLAGWLPDQSGAVTVQADGSGNPGGAARVFGDGGFFTEPSGEGSVTQNFLCGEEGSESNCVVSFQYRHQFDSGVQVRLQALIDGGIQYTTMLGGVSSPWTDVSFSIPCGSHSLKLRAIYQDGSANDEWRVWFDNVTAECESPVANEEMEWGALKATYQ